MSKCKIKIYKDKTEVNIIGNFTKIDKKLLDTWLNDKINHANEVFSKYPYRECIKEWISLERLYRLYKKED